MLTEFDFLGPENTSPGTSSKLSSKKKKSKYPLTSTQINDSLLDDEGNPFEEANIKTTKRGTARLTLEERVFQRQLEEAMELSRTVETSTMNSTLPLSNEASGSPLEVIEINTCDTKQPQKKSVKESSAPVDDDFTVSVSNKENKIRISRMSKKKPIIIDDDSDDDFPEGPVSLKSFKKPDKSAAEKQPPPILIECENTKGNAKRKREEVSPPKSEKNTSNHSKTKAEKKQSSHPNDKEKLPSSPEKRINDQLRKDHESKSKQSEDNSTSVKTKSASKKPKYNDDDYSEEDPHDEPESEEEYSPVKKSKKSVKKDKKKASDKSPKESKSKKKASKDKEVLQSDTASLQPKPHTEIKSKPISDPPSAESKNVNSNSPVVSAPKKAVSNSGPIKVSQPSNKTKPVSTTPKMTSRPITPKIIPKWTPPARIGQNNGSTKADQKTSPVVGIRVGLSRKFKASKPLHSNVKFTP